MSSITEKHEEKIEYNVYDSKHETFDEQVEVQNIDERSLAEEFVEEYQFTWRAAIIGSLLGCLVGKFVEKEGGQTKTRLPGLTHNIVFNSCL
jgi:hypothetical protein